MVMYSRILLLFWKLLEAGILGNLIAEQSTLRPENRDQPYLDESFDNDVKKTLEHWKVPGLSIAVIDGDNIYAKGYGFSTLSDKKATADTRYFTGSTTKAFVAAALGQLVHNTSHSEISWTSPVNQFLRADFVLEDDHATTHTTIEDALSHRTGLPSHDLIYGVPGDTPAAIVARLRSLPVTAEPRTRFQYCNLMYVVMTELLETVTGVKLENLLQERFWGPLGMRSTSFTLPADTSKSDLARGYFWDTTADKYLLEPYLDLLPISGAGATISTVNDYALWIKALLSAADPHSSTNHSSPLTPAIFHDLVTPRTIISDTSFSQPDDPWGFVNPPMYSLGWFNLKVGGETIISHEGGLTGFGTAVYLLPEHHFGIAMMGNTAITSNQAQAELASVLIKRRLRKTGGDENARLANMKETLHAASRATGSMSRPEKIRPFIDHQRNRDSPQSLSLPLPGVLSDFAGLYTHPAYGLLNFTVINTTASSTSIFLATVSPRTWPCRLSLRHTTDTVFALTISAPHGIGDELIWTEEDGEDTRKAIFKFGLDGETVETMGIEIERSMVEVARSKGEKAWKEGMVWFERE